MSKIHVEECRSVSGFIRYCHRGGIRIVKMATGRPRNIVSKDGESTYQSDITLTAFSMASSTLFRFVEGGVEACMSDTRAVGMKNIIEIEGFSVSDGEWTEELIGFLLK
jgi:hypothetical protein